MISGIGTDLIEIERVKKACVKEHFLRRYYTEREIETFGKNYTALAGNFAVKEAVAKSLGTGFAGCMPIDIEVLRDERGKPYVNLYGGAKTIADREEIQNIHVSITNTAEYAQAFAVSEKNLHIEKG